MILEQIRMDLNHIYGVNEDGNVVVSSLMEHAIVRVVIVAMCVKKNRNIVKLLVERMQDPIEEGGGPDERTHCKKLQRSSPNLFLSFSFDSSLRD